MEVCYGTTRTVVLVGSWAFKFPSTSEWRLFLCGLLGNMQERKFATMGDPRLCPVRFSIPGGWLNVMPRTRPLTRDEFELFDPDVFLADGDYSPPVEFKQDSFGWLNDRIVAVDYGS